MNRLFSVSIFFGLFSFASHAEAGFITLDFSFSSNITGMSGYGTLQALSNGDGSYTAVSGNLYDNFGDNGLTLVTNSNAPGVTNLPNGLDFDNQIFPMSNPLLDGNGLLFGVGGGINGLDVNFYSFGPGSYAVADSNFLFDPTISFSITSSVVAEPTSMIPLGISMLTLAGYSIYHSKREQ